MAALDTERLSEIEKEEVKEKVRQQMAVVNFQDLLAKMTEKCFKKCIDKPGTTLDISEQKCLAMCMDRFVDSWQLVSKAYSNRIKKENQRI